MSKKKKKKTQFNGNKSGHNLLVPKVFFKRIGIRPIAKPEEEGSLENMEKEIQRRFGQDIFNKVAKMYDDENPVSGFDVYHSDLRLVKIWYGVAFYRLCDIASRLAELSIPEKLNILDVGGGPGHLSFWLAQIWNPAYIVVADSFAEVGTEWAKRLKEHRVSFIASKLPELEEIGNETYDVVILSRVLSFMPELNLPQSIPDWTLRSYLKSKAGNELYTKLFNIGKRLNDIIVHDGRVIVVDSWSDFRAMLIGKAFEAAGLNINTELFTPEKVGPNPSPIVFTKSVKPIPLKDIPRGLSMVIRFPTGPPVFIGTAACTIRNFFNGGKTIDRFEYEDTENQRKGYNEIVEKEGLLLIYKATNDGIHNAWIFPGICIWKIWQVFNEMKNGVEPESLSFQKEIRYENFNSPDKG